MASLACLSILTPLLIYLHLLPLVYLARYAPAEGDIIFQSLPRSSELVRAIEGVSGSPYSHCGVVVFEDGEWQVNEALGLVHSTPLYEWVRRGRGACFDVYRLRPEFAMHIPAFVSALETYGGRPYDSRYRMDDGSIYCSELVYKSYRDATGQALGVLVQLGSMNWKPYQATIEGIEGGEVPLERLMITPRDLARAPQLQLSCSAGY